MNDNSPESEGLDPDLIDLFDTAAPVDTNDEAFMSVMLARISTARRARMFVRLALTAMIVVVGAVLAPYVAEATLTTADWLVDRLPETARVLASPIGCVCAALIAWRIARRRFG